MSRVLALASGKGGAGKTSVCVNLAFALARGGRRVLILDADLGLSNVDVLLGLAPEKSLEHVLFEGLPLASARVAAAPLVDVISGGSGVARLAELDREARRRLAAEFSGLSGYDYVLVDNSPGISGQVLSLCLACNEVLVVVNPEAASVVDAYALVKLLRAGGLSRPPGLVLNRVSGEGQARAVFARFAATARERLDLSCAFLGFVPEDRAVASAAARQTPLVLAHPASAAARAFLGLALTLDTRPGQGASGRVLEQNPGVFFERAVVGALERGGTSVAASGAGEAAETARLALAGIETALSRLAGVEEAGPRGQAMALAQARAELVRLRRTLAGDGPGDHPEDRSAPPSGGRTQSQAPDRPAWIILCPDPFRAELLREVAGEAGLAFFSGDGPGCPAGILAWDPDLGAAGELAQRWPGAAWVLVGDARSGNGFSPGPAVERVAAPFRLEEVLTALRRAGHRTARGPGGRA